MLSEAALLDWFWTVSSIDTSNCFIFSSDIPYQNIATCSCTDYDVWVMRIENCFGHFVLTIQSNLRSRLHGNRVNVYLPIWLVSVPFPHLAVRCQKQLRDRRGPVKTSDWPLVVLFVFKNKLFWDVANFDFSVFTYIFIFVVNKKLPFEIKFCA